MGIGAGLVLWQSRTADHGSSETSMSREDIELFLTDFNPNQLKALAESPQEKARPVKNLKEVLGSRECGPKGRYR